MGNKNRLLNKIDMLLQEVNADKKGLIFCDLFSGTGSVAENYNGFYKIIANDILDVSYHVVSGKLLQKRDKFKNLGFDPFTYLNERNFLNYNKGFCYNNFCPNGGSKYFSDTNAKKIDFIRDTIDYWFKKNLINKEEKSYLIYCLIEAVSKVSNVAGVYSACLKTWDSRALKEMSFAPIKTISSRYKNSVYCIDANKLIDEISGDILYIDPPYTSTQYNSQYHVLETIARNDSPAVHGVGRHRDNDRLSLWCKKGFVEFEFENIIKKAKFRHIIFSYSDKGLMSKKFIECVMKRYAKDGSYIFKKINYSKYQSSRSKKREAADKDKTNIHYEYLFYIEKNDDPIYSSPLNYVGGKSSSIKWINSNIKETKGIFYDLFGGGATVAINSNFNKIVYNDINLYVVDLLNYLKNSKPPDIYEAMRKIEKKYKLNKGFKEGYYKLRDDYNTNKNNVYLFALICYGFEHQIRFNSLHEFNNPCGNSSFNDSLYEKLISFYLRCQEIDITFSCGNYLDYEKLIKPCDVVYLDPPYYTSRGSYQDGKRGFNGWDASQEKELHNFLASLDSKGVKFYLSNFTNHKQANNILLKNTVKKNSWKVVKQNTTIKRNRQNRKEILVIN